MEEEGLGRDNGRLKTRFWYSQGRARVIYKVEHRRGEGMESGSLASGLQHG